MDDITVIVAYVTEEERPANFSDDEEDVTRCSTPEATTNPPPSPSPARSASPELFVDCPPLPIAYEEAFLKTAAWEPKSLKTLRLQRSQSVPSRRVHCDAHTSADDGCIYTTPSRCARSRTVSVELANSCSFQVLQNGPAKARLPPSLWDSDRPLHRLPPAHTFSTTMFVERL